MENEKEIWKDIPGYEGFYQASSLGRIRSLDREIIAVRAGKEHTRIRKGRVLKPSLLRPLKTYLMCPLNKEGKQKCYTVHQLVMAAFEGVWSNRKMVIDHIDHNPLNNRYDNLQFLTHRQNISRGWKRNGYRGRDSSTGTYMIKSTGKFMASMGLSNKNIYLGVYETEEEASEIYKKAVEIHKMGGCVEAFRKNLVNPYKPRS